MCLQHISGMQMTLFLANVVAFVLEFGRWMVTMVHSWELQRIEFVCFQHVCTFFVSGGWPFRWLGQMILGLYPRGICFWFVNRVFQLFPWILNSDCKFASHLCADGLTLCWFERNVFFGFLDWIYQLLIVNWRLRCMILGLSCTSPVVSFLFSTGVRVSFGALHGSSFWCTVI